MNIAKNILLAALISSLPAIASAAPLTVVNVGAPAINCVFNATCTVTVSDSIGNYPPATGYTGTPRLQTRTYPGQAGTPGAGLTAFEYRVDFTPAVAASDINCATNLKIKFGPVARLPYARGRVADVFVVTTGGIGSIGISSANRVGNVITFTFATPVCPANGVNAPAQSSFFFGLASKGVPVVTVAKSALTFGGGVVDVAARAPLP
ncbi:MAG TPA: hypothetical protein VII56_02775 [Rhizomicrobium sp.]